MLGDLARSTVEAGRLCAACHLEWVLSTTNLPEAALTCVPEVPCTAHCPLGERLSLRETKRSL